MRNFLKKIFLKVWPLSLFMRRIQELHEMNNFLREENNKKLTEISILNDKLIFSQKALEKEHVDKETLSQDLETLKEKQRALLRELETLRTEKGTLSQYVQEKNTELQVAHQKLKNKESEIQSVHKILENKNEELRATCQRLESIAEELKVAYQNLENKNLEVQTIHQEKNVLEQELLLLKKERHIEYGLQMKRTYQSEHKISKDDEIITSASFWDRHYLEGGNSGTGSYGRLAQFKSDIVNRFLTFKDITSVLEIGCGDGNQLKMIHYKKYTGVDVSMTVIDHNREIFKDDPNKKFFCSLTERACYTGKVYDLTISMDVIFHLLEDDVFYQYMDDIFTLSDKYVIIYSSNHEEYTPWSEYRHRNFTGYVAEHFPEWKLIEYIPNKYPYQIGKESETSASDFYIFQQLY